MVGAPGFMTLPQNRHSFVGHYFKGVFLGVSKGVWKINKLINK
jgi:hypothetical protein